MNEKNVKLAQDAYRASMETATSPFPINTSREIENSLVGLLKFQASKIEADESYETELKSVIRDRFAEATFKELTDLLGQHQRNTNTALGNLLLPFIPKTDRVPLMDSDNNKDGNRDAGETTFNKAPTEVLQALDELSKAVNFLNLQKKELEEVEKLEVKETS